MDEMIKEWLRDLYDDAIDVAKESIRNERGWQNGAEDDDEILMYQDNIDREEEYIRVLQELKRNVEDM